MGSCGAYLHPTSPSPSPSDPIYTHTYTYVCIRCLSPFLHVTSLVMWTAGGDDALSHLLKASGDADTGAEAEAMAGEAPVGAGKEEAAEQKKEEEDPGKGQDGVQNQKGKQSVAVKTKGAGRKANALSRFRQRGQRLARQVLSLDSSPGPATPGSSRPHRRRTRSSFSPGALSSPGDSLSTPSPSSRWSLRRSRRAEDGADLEEDQETRGRQEQLEVAEELRMKAQDQADRYVHALKARTRRGQAALRKRGLVATEVKGRAGALPAGSSKEAKALATTFRRQEEERLKEREGFTDSEGEEEEEEAGDEMEPEMGDT